MNLLNIEKIINYEFNNKNINMDNLEDDLLFFTYIINNIVDNKIRNELFYYENNSLNIYFNFKDINDLKNLLISDDYLNERITKLRLNNELDYDNPLNDFKLLIVHIIKDSNNYELVENLLNIEDAMIKNINSENNYAKLVFEWAKRKYNGKPQIEITNDNLVIKLEGIEEEFKYPYKTKLISLFEASKLAYSYLESNNLLLKMTDIIGLPDQDRCINQLQELFAKGFINEPVYKIAMKGTNNGVDIWKCRIMIDGYKESFSAEDTSKKNAKRIVALQMLKYILDNE